jgi:transforming growth factor-beta-induced protein
MALVAIAGCSKKNDDMSFQQPDQELFNIPTTLENLSNKAVTEKDGVDDKDAKGYYHRPTYWTLLTALAKTDLLGTVVKNRLTLFAPTDQAFAELGLNSQNIGSVPNLKEILLYHVIKGRVYSFKLKDDFVPTLNGAAVEIKVDDKIMVNGAEVLYANIWALNGVIHVIDKVLLPPDKNIVELALSFKPEFSILVDAVVKAGLVETLATGGPFTVFAPTNQAFYDLLDELGFSSLDDLINNLGVEGLKNVLLYHVVSGRVYSSDLVSGPVTTLNGTFTVDVSNLTLTDAKGRKSNLVPTLLNVQATNGVVHVIDKVILP